MAAAAGFAPSQASGATTLWAPRRSDAMAPVLAPPNLGYSIGHCGISAPADAIVSLAGGAPFSGTRAAVPFVSGRSRRRLRAECGRAQPPCVVRRVCGELRDAAPAQSLCQKERIISLPGFSAEASLFTNARLYLGHSERTGAVPGLVL